VHGPDLPTASEPFTVDVCQHRWPTGAEKAESYNGVLVFGGALDQRDVEIAQRAYPGREIVLNAGGGLEVAPGRPARVLFHRRVLRNRVSAIR
jgi:hypothetical protein